MMCFGKAKDPAADAQNRKIEDGLANDKKSPNVKLLLLGAGESGKSTIAKQMKIIHLDGFSEEEREGFKSIIFSNIMGSIRVLVEAAETLNIPVNDPATTTRVLNDAYVLGDFTQQVVSDVKRLWANPGIQATFQRASEFQLNDSAAYYFNEIDRIGAPGYVPNVQDVLRSRAKTTGIIETHFTVQKTNFTLVDVGGQRSERRKWMHCFQDVTAVIFCAAMSEYDQKLYEDETTNRMHEALKLFKDICNSKWFAETAIILFLNKEDIFQEKIGKVPLTVCFKDYTGPNTAAAAGQYIEDQFLAQNENPRKLIYPKRTCATDTDNVSVVFKAVQDIVLNRILERLGM